MRPFGFLKWPFKAFTVGGGSAMAGVTSFIGRAGAVIAVAGDYAASLVTNDSSVAGTYVKDALNTLNTAIGLLAPKNLPAVSVTSSRALAATDAGKLLVCNSGSTIDLTVNASIFTAEDVVYILRKGAGAVNVVNGTATVQASNGLKGLAYQYSKASLWFETAALAYMDGERA